MILPNGTVLPHGLLGCDDSSSIAGFNKTYKNNSLRLGIVIHSYSIDDDNNLLGLTTEYDVLVFEQMEDRGSTVITYRNCMSIDGLGSIADFFEKSFRIRTKSNNDGNIDTKNQNGAVVLLLCLDGVSEKALIIGGVNHPDRPTTLNKNGPHLEGEYNGVNIVVNSDGSTSLTFKGATDNYGKPIDPTQGDTVMSIEKDGSYQVKHRTITQRLDKNGKASLTADDDISNTTKTSFNVTTTKDVNINATGDMSSTMNNLTFNAQGSAQLACQKLSVQSQSDLNLSGQTMKVQAESIAGIKAPQITLDGTTFLGGQGGQPVLLLSTVMVGIGNLGGIVVSQAISGFAVNTFAT